MSQQAKPFFITGLPRSRTAWMSLFTTTGRTLCYHEPQSMIREIEDVAAIYDSNFYSHLGISDSGLGFFSEWILENIKPRTLVIDRDIKEVEESLMQLGIPPTNYCELLREKLLAIKKHPLVMWVPFEALKEKRVMQKAFWHLLPGVEFDEVRYEEFCDFHIEVNAAKTAAKVAKHKDQIAHFMRDIYPHLRLKEA